MKGEEKELLLKDLCSRLPHGVMVKITSDGGMMEASYNVELNAELFTDLSHTEDDFKPYLRPMSSMTEVEQEKVRLFIQTVADENYGDWFSPSAWRSMTEFDDYCCSRHLDHRGLIFQGLALEAPEGMYN